MKINLKDFFCGCFRSNRVDPRKKANDEQSLTQLAKAAFQNPAQAQEDVNIITTGKGVKLFDLSVAEYDHPSVSQQGAVAQKTNDFAQNAQSLPGSPMNINNSFLDFSADDKILKPLPANNYMSRSASPQVPQAQKSISNVYSYTQ